MTIGDNEMNYSQEELKIAPWLKSYGDVKFHLDYPDYSMSEALFISAQKYPNQVALTFEGKDTTFAKLVPQIMEAEKAFRAYLRLLSQRDSLKRDYQKAYFRRSTA